MSQKIFDDEHCSVCTRIMHWKYREKPTCRYCEKTIAAIKGLVDSGVQVYWKQANYKVFNANGSFVIVCSNNGDTIGLTNLDGDRLNGHPDDFFYIDKVSKKRVPVSYIVHVPWDGSPDHNDVWDIPIGRPQMSKGEFNEQYMQRPTPPLERQQVGGNHYAVMGMDPIKFCMANRWDNCAFSALKYLSRFRRKNGVEDLDKAADFIRLRDIYDEPIHKEMMRNRYPIHEYIKVNGFIGLQGYAIFQLWAWACGKRSSAYVLELIESLKTEFQREST